MLKAIWGSAPSEGNPAMPDIIQTIEADASSVIQTAEADVVKVVDTVIADIESAAAKIKTICDKLDVALPAQWAELVALAKVL